MSNSTQYRRDAYWRYRSEGRCGNCGRTDERTKAGRSICSRCYEGRTAYFKAYNEKAMQKYYERKKMGLCVSCGTERDNRTLRCSCCRKKQNDASMRYARKWMNSDCG
jgi:hypothetical protein